MARIRHRPEKPASEPWKDDLWQPIPAPEVTEGGESVWEQWNEASRRMDLAFASTQPSDRAPLLDGTAAPQAQGMHWSPDEVMLVARRNNRVCPKAPIWLELYRLLEGERYADLEPPPVQAWQWGKLSNLQKRLRFREHIDWAERHGMLSRVAAFIQQLPETDWVHMGES